MKNRDLIMALVMLMGVTGWSQDTVLSDRPKENCYYTSWAEGDTLASCGMRVGGMSFTDLATAYYSKDTLKIYGVAISAVARDKGPDNPYYHDTTLDSMYCQVRVYESLGDSLGVLRESRLHLRDSAVSYYLAADRWDFTNYRPDGSLGKFDPIPVYELFFEQPVSVCDSFYIGFFFDKDIMLYDSISRRQYYPYRYHMAALGFKSFKGRAEPIVYAQRFRPDNVNHPGDWLFIRNATEYLYMYAITEPGDGTSGGGSGSDTTLTAEPGGGRGAGAVEPRAARHRGLQRRRAEGLRGQGQGPRGHPRRQGMAPRHLPPPHHHLHGHCDEEAAGGVRQRVEKPRWRPTLQNPCPGRGFFFVCQKLRL